MAKRFTDTEKWKKVWFRKLTPDHKCFWQYLIDNCNHAGIWDVDFELAAIFIGVSLDEEHIKQVFKKQYKEICEGKKWLIVDFIDFQYGKLNPENRAHKSVIDILNKEGVYKGLTRGLQARKDKDKDMDMDKDKEYSEEFKKFWNEYPNKKAKLYAYQCFKKIKIPLNALLVAIQKQKNGADWKKEGGRYIPHPATWLNKGQWEDEIETKNKDEEIWKPKT